MIILGLMRISRQLNMKCCLVRMIVLAICSYCMKHNFNKTGEEWVEKMSF